MSPRSFPLRACARRQGVALPVMLIILVVMLVTSIYMLRSTHSSALTTGNLAYDATMSREVDYGLHRGFQWLQSTAASNKAALNTSDAPHGYEAKLPTADVRDPNFWTNAAPSVTGPDGATIDYVVHRLCNMDGVYGTSSVHCMQTEANTAPLGNAVALGASLASDTQQYAGQPQLHYLITARIHGARGGNVINQMIVLIGT